MLRLPKAKYRRRNKQTKTNYRTKTESHQSLISRIPPSIFYGTLLTAIGVEAYLLEYLPLQQHYQTVQNVLDQVDDVATDIDIGMRDVMSKAAFVVSGSDYFLRSELRKVHWQAFVNDLYGVDLGAITITIGALFGFDTLISGDLADLMYPTTSWYLRFIKYAKVVFPSIVDAIVVVVLLILFILLML
eukprot:TRINITY_DN4470_c0_g1_i2.p1 TRINITY_DN4470_c0_g1~~TRINITY_DN4470_c0_g1_i2.p1  ORF type:complete len:188 (+),score=28.74 TRINITY_DN4470_c0_g1_i2:74-637(+)